MKKIKTILIVILTVITGVLLLLFDNQKKQLSRLKTKAILAKTKEEVKAIELELQILKHDKELLLHEQETIKEILRVLETNKQKILADAKGPKTKEEIENFWRAYDVKTD